MRSVLFALSISAVACSSASRGAHSGSRSPERFEELSTIVVQHLYRIDPASAIQLGLHEYDGALPDVSPAGIAAAIADLEHDRAALEAVDRNALTAIQRDELDVLLQQVRARHFGLAELDAYRKNPCSYADNISLDAYIVRDYAPVGQRAAAVAKLCARIPAYLAQARANLAGPMPKPWLDTALLQTRGYADFVDHDMRQVLAAVPAAGAALDSCKRAFDEHATWLERQLPNATDRFALGEATFLRMLAETQGISTDLAHLRVLAEADLARNTNALVDAAHAIDPTKPVADVVRAAADDRPTPLTELPVATEQVAQLRAFLVANHIVTIPADETPSVRAAPPFQRWNAAFFDGPGPFERGGLASYYYLSPPDPSWPADEQRAYVPPRADLLFTTVHEVYPGHFLHSLHIHQNPSRVLRSFCTYTTSEGWAHYAEEMMYDAGVGDHAPAAHIGQLKEALLRDARFLVAIGEHTGGMSVDEATKLFVDTGFVDAANARQQAVRGTFDPMFLSYTLGKLMIRRLYTDWRAAHPTETLGAFHDELLSHACAPLPVIRRAMLGDATGPGF